MSIFNFFKRNRINEFPTCHAGIYHSKDYLSKLIEQTLITLGAFYSNVPTYFTAVRRENGRIISDSRVK